MNLVNFKVRVTDSLYANYTGQIGAYTFENGVSVEKLHRNDAVNFSHGFACEALDDDGTAMFEIISGAIPTTSEMQQFNLETELVTDKKKVAKKEIKKAVDVKTNIDRYTIEQLEEMADRSGMSELREVAKTFNVKAKSIPELIERIIAAQE